MSETVAAKKVLFVEGIKIETVKTVEDQFQVSALERKLTKEGKPFLAVRLKDRTGEIEARWWDVPSSLVQPKIGAIVKVKAQVVAYQGQAQLQLSDLSIVAAEEVVRDDYLPASREDRDKLLFEVYRWVVKIEGEQLRKAVTACVYWTEAKLKDAPAAKGNHQAYLGGLAEHIIRLCKLVVRLCEVYPELNQDVLLAGAVLHDIGKCFELCFDEHIGYSREGELVGHIIQGSIYWDRFTGDLDKATKDHVAHIIASHHGKLEWGAAKLPMTREAYLFHLLDLCDSRFEMYTNAVKAGVDEMGFSARVPQLENVLVWDAK